VLAFLTVAWATSHVVFGVPWAVSTYVDDIRETPCDVPAFWTASASSFRRHWSAFHVSLSSFYFARMYAPLGSGHVGVVVVVAFSTLFHGFETGWLVWGAVNAAGLTIERLIDDSYPGWRFASRGARLARACDGTVATCATVAMVVGDGFDAKAWAWVVMWIFAGFVAFGED
jgi:D-alanyl-lipoteichoic acid acyltransferase DltB (MBOAT superfamily)